MPVQITMTSDQKALFRTSILCRYATRMPSGLVDMDSYRKLGVETQELLAASEPIEKLLEAADCLYYATKCLFNGLIDQSDYKSILSYLENKASCSIETIQEAARIKYFMRSRKGNPKNPPAEKDAVSHLLTRKE